MKLISLNIEADKHLELQLPFFKSESPDILCLQEISEPAFMFFKNALGMDGQFASMCTQRRRDDRGKEILVSRGIAMLCLLVLRKSIRIIFLLTM